jgi:hypothetical protein
MTEASLWIPRRQRPPKIHQPCARRAWLGELIQIDDSDHQLITIKTRNQLVK